MFCGNCFRGVWVTRCVGCTVGGAVKSHLEQGEYISIRPSNSQGHRDGCQSDNWFSCDTELCQLLHCMAVRYKGRWWCFAVARSPRSLEHKSTGDTACKRDCSRREERAPRTRSGSWTVRKEDSTRSSASKKRKRPPRLSMFEIS